MLQKNSVKREIVVSLSVSAALGALIWAMSPVVTGSAEPWDAGSSYYVVSLFVAGAIVGALIPRHLWAVLLGIVVGQLIYMLAVLPAGPLLPLGVVFLVGFGLLALLGAVVSALIRRWSERVGTGGGHRA